MTTVKEDLMINHETYQLASQLFENQHVVYRNFIITQKGVPVLNYELGITQIALIIYKEDKFNTSEMLLKIGIKAIKEMIHESNFSHTTGVITSVEMSKGEFSWRELSPLIKDQAYTQ